ncbi:hypothetical protein [Cedecea sp. NFIX57]|uniref:hypothetical protein n=1 Tax=Cedecea sp. NFIX57 TaxID=1566286 RepID=UPI000A0D205D|nr:hypothetical protein [Cedecea sp. NFIX57]SMG60159.1 hypothetical protein SAMN03159353_10348 [Cedecea sp. NFIX57]
MAWVALAAAAVSALGAMKQGNDAKAAANYNAAQTQADAQANTAAAKVQAQRIREQGAKQASQANAAFGASGVEADSGTALRVTSGIAGDAEQDAYQTILNGVNSSNRMRAQAQADRLSGKQAQQAGMINAGSSLLSSGSKMYSGWKN